MEATLTTTHPFFDLENNPRHFLNLLPESISKVILSVPHKYLEMTEEQLIHEAFRSKYPDETSTTIRLRFWEEYHRAFESGTKMTIKRIVNRVLSSNPTALREYLSTNPARTAYIIKLPQEVENTLNYAFQLSLKNIVKKLTEDELINQKTGLPDASLMKVKIELFKYLDQRLHGSIVQRHHHDINQKTLQVNVSPENAKQSIQSAEDRIKQIEAELSTYNALPPSIDTTSVIMEKTIQEAGRITDDFRRKDR